MFVSLIKMMIVPVIFCTIVLGIGKVRAAATVGKVGGLAFVYFLVMSTVALAIGLVVGNLLSPGTGLNLEATSQQGRRAGRDRRTKAGGLMDFVQGIIPTSLFSSLTEGNVLQALFVALLVGFALQGMGSCGRAGPARHRAPAEAGVQGAGHDPVAGPDRCLRRHRQRRRPDRLERRHPAARR